MQDDADDDSLWGRPGTWVAVLSGLVFIALSAWFGCHAYTKWGSDAFWSGLGKFATSPGFGGLMAVLAAVVAFYGVRSATRSSQRIARADRQQSFRTSQQDHWWEQARWALDLVVGNEDEESRTLGYEALKTLLAVDPQYRPVGAAEMVQTVTKAPLAIPEEDIQDFVAAFEKALKGEAQESVDADADPEDNPKQGGGV
ncbi:hypothetical protein QM787_22265 [Rhodococcus ruber]|uniref:Uncharacterized protein n=1 Tax=Rhodococcus ruber TaxID=1830 RepID=A0A098BFK3_9NOCA|nr:hypothetical protein [Rhodococcus ruber]MCD2129539.1 hypothetical protein [Rhodococcus ruber]MCZ4505417.1 hypothetical protein [Rhodococcus ruber]MCZ4532848.1 hypothetical protein [Rhodococcus ruber]MCZ4532885.1 hypothetical protein [Rhodococcus ruber]MCZ4623013.1 hypothetical protein [Rhodococcus ruber]